MTRGVRRTFPQKGLGRVPHWDDRNENYRIRDVVRALAAAPQTPNAPIKPRTQRYWNDHAWYGDQGQTNECTAYSLLHFMADGPVTHRGKNPLMEPALLYEAIQREDLAEGRDYGVDGGATMLAQQKAAVKLGWVGEYRWGTTLDELVSCVLDVSPVLLGIGWYTSMFSPDAKGHIRVSGALAGGHAIECNGVNTKRAFARLKNSWSTEWGEHSHCYIDFDDLERLIREEGEIVLARELPSSKGSA